MSQKISGIHHVTAITADAQKNIDFYCGVLGLRLVKISVNFDDPQSYHFYYGDAFGAPGTIMTFFAWPGAAPARKGVRQCTATSFCVPAASLDFWKKRLVANEHNMDQQAARFGESVLELDDPDGIRLELVGRDVSDLPSPRTDGPVPAQHAIRSFHGVTLSEDGYEHTAELLTKTMGFRPQGNEGNRFRFVAEAKSASVVDVLCAPDMRQGSMGAGAIHHVAYRTQDDDAQRRWRELLVRERYNVSPVMDRKYFHSIYFREPGGVLFEIATDGPGFAVDEPAASLGTSLMLPSQYEHARAAIKAVLPRVRLPGGKIL